MKIGDLRFLVDIEEPLETKGPLGDVEQTWTYRGRAFAAIEPISGDEKFAFMQQKATIDTKITLRGNAVPYLTPKYRIKWIDETARVHLYDIEFIADMQNRRIKTEVFCKEAA